MKVIKPNNKSGYCIKHVPRPDLSKSGRYCKYCDRELGMLNQSGVCHDHQYDNGKPERQQCAKCAVKLHRDNKTGLCTRCARKRKRK